LQKNKINRLDIKIDDDENKSSLQHDDNFVIAIDSTGIKVTNRGEWIRHKWKVKRGYLKIHIAVDITKKRNFIVTGNKNKYMMEKYYPN
jgi:hypothetical protein